MTLHRLGLIRRLRPFCVFPLPTSGARSLCHCSKARCYGICCWSLCFAWWCFWEHPRSA